MKKIRNFLQCLLSVSAAILVSCGGTTDPNAGLEQVPGTTSDIDPVIVNAADLTGSLDSDRQNIYLVMYMPGATSYTDKTAYMWTTGGSGTTSTVALTDQKQGTYKYGYMCVYNGSTVAAGLPADVADALTAGEDVNLIMKNLGNTWTWQTPDLIVPLSSKSKHYLVYCSGKKSKDAASVYELTDELKPKISTAKGISGTELKVDLTVKLALQGTASDNGFVITDSDGNKVTVTDVKNYEYKDSDDRTHNYTTSLYLKLGEELDLSKIYTISNDKFGSANVVTSTIISKVLENIVYDKSDLGLTFESNGNVTFKTWAPLASDVKLLLYPDSDSVKSSEPSEIKSLSKDTTTGVWSISADTGSYKYYKYRITNGTDTNDVCDIYAKSASPDSIAAQIVDINSDSNAIPSGYSLDSTYGTKAGYYNPFGSSGSETKTYPDAVIYEMHIRDWSRLAVTDSTGKFLDIANSTAIINHIKELGVTHVQIIPMFDYAQTIGQDDDNDGVEDYNWGYNPYHYNVPEGRYVTKGYEDGTQAVNEMRQMIAEFHKAGIAVNMDVVFNHTSGKGKGSLYDMTVPYYYYRLTSDGDYSNGSGCGNETNSGAPMFRKYMIESLKHWMLDYHINGFRFDLMGLHECETMKEIYKELSAIDKNVMVYGEPWTGGSSPVENGTGKAVINDCADDTYSTNGVACFNDDFRNAIKGSEYPDFAAGEVSKATDATGNVIVKGLKNICFEANLGRSINYCECHDNLTVADKIALVMNGKTAAEKGNLIGVSSDEVKSDIMKYGKIGELKKRDILAASYILLSPGTPFLNGGQEFLRSKNGDDNSYISKDEINEIKQSYIDEYADVTEYYKGMIALRKAYPDDICNNTSVTAERIDIGLIKLVEGSIVVYFNSNTTATDIPEDKQVEGKVITLSSGDVVIASSATTETSVPALSALVLLK